MNSLRVRKNIRLLPLNYVGHQRYFVTLCCFRRQNIFSDPKHCQDLLALLQSECAARCFRVPAYCLMPDHLHFLAEGLHPASDLLHLLKSFKMKSSRKYSVHKTRILWQKGFYEHILRPNEAVESVAWYIWLNPVRKGMVSNVRDYLFAGSFTGMSLPATWGAADWQPPWKSLERSGPSQKADPTRT
jgi:putative transposase